MDKFLKLRTSLNHFGLKYKLVLRANQAAFQKLQKLQAPIVSASGELVIHNSADFKNISDLALTDPYNL
jgi:hypothetical protein